MVRGALGMRSRRSRRSGSGGCIVLEISAADRWVGSRSEIRGGRCGESRPLGGEPGSLFCFGGGILQHDIMSTTGVEIGTTRPGQYRCGARIGSPDEGSGSLRSRA